MDHLRTEHTRTSDGGAMLRVRNAPARAPKDRHYHRLIPRDGQRRRSQRRIGDTNRGMLTTKPCSTAMLPTTVAIPQSMSSHRSRVSASMCSRRKIRCWCARLPSSNRRPRPAPANLIGRGGAYAHPSVWPPLVLVRNVRAQRFVSCIRRHET